MESVIHLKAGIIVRRTVGGVVTTFANKVKMKKAAEKIVYKTAEMEYVMDLKMGVTAGKIADPRMFAETEYATIGKYLVAI